MICESKRDPSRSARASCSRSETFSRTACHSRTVPMRPIAAERTASASTRSDDPPGTPVALTSRMETKGARQERIEITMPQTGSVRQERELGAFVRYCVNRIEQSVGAREGWTVKILHILGAGY